jgi:hypothetical protein
MLVAKSITGLISDGLQREVIAYADFEPMLITGCFFEACSGV